ncbi:SDR family oxidoreductase [Frankia sp. Cpl3]|uniref:SDR family oxidoreductase n=1 Tax=Parafrankia colletiae TaxID=573497 RepID=UPI001F5273D1|nr:SDR family oxidoreductase [Frankia sp. Cpl3]
MAISPGTIETPGAAEQFAVPEVREALFGGDLIPRPGQPVKVVDLAVLLASDEASFITGANFVVDGGMSVI